MKFVGENIPSKIVKVDPTRPIVQFDPWPFTSETVSISAPCYWVNSDGVLFERNVPGHSGIVLNKIGDCMAVATDGRLVIGTALNIQRNLKRYS